MSQDSAFTPKLIVLWSTPVTSYSIKQKNLKPSILHASKRRVFTAPNIATVWDKEHSFPAAKKIKCKFQLMCSPAYKT
jgi:hypothetical protein